MTGRMSFDFNVRATQLARRDIFGIPSRTNRPSSVLAPPLHYLMQVLSAAKAACADACVGRAAPITFILLPAAGWALTTSHFIVALSCGLFQFKRAFNVAYWHIASFRCGTMLR